MQPQQAAALESALIELGKDALEGVVGGHSVGQLQEPLKPRFTFRGKKDDLMPVVVGQVSALGKMLRTSGAAEEETVCKPGRSIGCQQPMRVAIYL